MEPVNGGSATSARRLPILESFLATKRVGMDSVRYMSPSSLVSSNSAGVPTALAGWV